MEIKKHHLVTNEFCHFYICFFKDLLAFSGMTIRKKIKNTRSILSKCVAIIKKIKNKKNIAFQCHGLYRPGSELKLAKCVIKL